MADVNLSGNQATQTYDHITNAYYVNAACTVTNGSTISNTVGTGQNPLIWNSNYAYTSSGTSGIFNLTASSTLPFRFQPSGAVTTWGTLIVRYIGPHSAGTGAWTLQYCQFWRVSLLDTGSGNSSWLNLQFFWDDGIRAFYCVRPSGTPTIDSLSFYYSATGLDISGGAGVKTITNLKIVRCSTGVSLGGTGITTLTNVLCHNCISGIIGTPASTSTLTRLIFLFPSAIAYQLTLTGTNTLTINEVYYGGGGLNTFYNAGTALPALSNAVIVAQHLINANILVRNFAVSTSDIIGQCNNTNAPIYDGTLASDVFIGGYRTSFSGKLGTYQDDWSQFSFFVDTDSGNTTSTTSPAGYAVLDSNRPASPPSTPNFLTTWSSVSVGSETNDGATITGTSGIKCKSRILLRASSAGATLLAGPWKYDGFLDEKKYDDFTLPVTSHSHVLTNLKASTIYYYVIEGIDPCNRRFLSTEGNFTTTSAGGGSWTFA